jgi:hypothetical protein
VVSTDSDVNRKNFDLISRTWRNGFGGKAPTETRKGLIFQDVDVEQLIDFLVQFETHSRFAARKGLAIDYLRAISGAYAVGDVLLISPGKGFSAPYVLNTQERASDGLDGTMWHLNKDRVASRGDEKLGLTDPQLKEAEAEALADATLPGARKRKEGKPVEPSDTHFRRVRKKPLLMIHSLEPKARKDQEPTEPKEVEGMAEQVAAFGISFPWDGRGITVEIVANKIWLETMQGPADDPDDEEDYDE